MITWAVIFFVIAIVAGLLGFTGIVGAATNMAWVIAVFGLALAIMFAIRGSVPRGQ
ncbi:DUF1328 domain-containing protein [Exilibacterium tricleocarpae]|uniref:UPF0391 membrane protein FKG94_19925 n=1 Tax=Exilibacterium tricleocarpae TaxID=2591008 RepID=A0A545T1R2_9GAMM|nr:DUF1328 domain-containing protein [Exilibacterium tricleocarpae]TQV71158.1 DUF1328 domain-containing protein [Exilibacterium tricleocarpae]